MRLDEVVLRALEKQPELRYQQVSEVKTMVETIAATPGQKSEIRNPKSEIAPRLSSTAVVGASWAVYVAIYAGQLLARRYVFPDTLNASAWWGMLSLFGQSDLLALTAVIGTTILGWVAVAQIRRSEGRRYGLWLAVFDGLLFPLLVLDGMMVGACIFDVHAFGSIIITPGSASWHSLVAAGAGRLGPHGLDGFPHHPPRLARGEPTARGQRACQCQWQATRGGPS